MNLPSTPTGPRMRRAERPADFRRFGVAPDVVTPAEDGQRVVYVPGHFEWWYCEVVLQNRAAIVLVFFNRPLAAPNAPLLPVVWLNLLVPGETRPRGRPLPFAPTDFAASTTRCDVTIGPNRFSGDLDTYRVVAAVDDIAVEIEIQRTVPPVRIGTGHLLFDRDGAHHYLGWLAAVPRGDAKARYTVAGATVEARGVAYHDHNWGDADLAALAHDWYWARAAVGAYTLIVSRVVAQRDYGGDEHVDVVLLDGDAFLACGSTHAGFAADPPTPDAVTGVPVADRLRWTFEGPAVRCAATFVRRATLLQSTLDGKPVDPAADPDGHTAYLRFFGSCTLELERDGTLEVLPAVDTTWEMMWFGRQPDPHAAMELMLRSTVTPKGSPG